MVIKITNLMNILGRFESGILSVKGLLPNKITSYIKQI